MRSDARNSAPVLSAMQAFQRCDVERGRLPGRVDVQRPPGAHAGGGGRELGAERGARGIGQGAVRERDEGLRLQRVAGEDRGRFVEGDVHGRLAATQRIVVHRRQVVVHQRIGVHQFHRDGRRIQRILVRPNAVPAAYTSSGRMRLPPSSTAWRIAACRRFGEEAGSGRGARERGVHPCAPCVQGAPAAPAQASGSNDSAVAGSIGSDNSLTRSSACSSAAWHLRYRPTPRS